MELILTTTIIMVSHAVHLVTLQRFFKFITLYRHHTQWTWLAATFPDKEPTEEDCPKVEEAKDADDMTCCLRMKMKIKIFKSFNLAFASLHTFVGLYYYYYVYGSVFAYKILTWSLLVCMPLCILLWCSGGGAQPIKVVGVLSRNCVIFESTPTLTFWPKRSAIWVGVLSSEYGTSLYIIIHIIFSIV